MGDIGVGGCARVGEVFVSASVKFYEKVLFLSNIQLSSVLNIIFGTDNV